MAYDEGLAERIRQLLLDYPNVVEEKMFGGLSFMLQGNFACGVNDNLVVRVGKEGHDAAMTRPYTSVMDFTGRPMKGWVYVDPTGIAEDEALAYWVQLGVDYALSLPAK